MALNDYVTQNHKIGNLNDIFLIHIPIQTL